MTTHPTPDAARAAGLPRSRRARENLFQYLRGEFGLDTLPQRGLEDVLAGETAVNPARRSVGKSLRKREGKLERPQALPAPVRDLLATLRIFACRAETRMAGQPDPGLGSPETARSLLRALFERPASPRPDPAAGTLTVRLMPMATQARDEALARPVADLNRSETTCPGTDLPLVCELPVEPEPPAPPLPPAGGPPSAPGTEPPPA